MRRRDDDRLVVFYGSLRKAHGALDRLGLRGRVEDLGPCRLRGRLYDLGRFPGLMPGDGEVTGELVRIKDDAALARFDAFEGFDAKAPRLSDYLRRRVALVEPPGVRAWVYVYNKPLTGRREVPGGDWTAHVRAKGQAPWPGIAR